jgi:hypothetical protein
MGETKTKYVCRMLGDGVLPRKHVRLGDVVKVPKRAVRIETPDHEREIPRQDKTQEESALPQGRGESLIAQLDSAVNQAEQLRDQQIQQQYSDQLGIYVQEKAQQIDRLQSSLAASLTSEQAQLQAIQQRTPGWTAGKKTHAQWEQQVARRNTRIAQIALRLDRVREIEEAAGDYAETGCFTLLLPMSSIANGKFFATPKSQNLGGSVCHGNSRARAYLFGARW